AIESTSGAPGERADAVAGTAGRSVAAIDVGREETGSPGDSQRRESQPDGNKGPHDLRKSRQADSVDGRLQQARAGRSRHIPDSGSIEEVPRVAGAAGFHAKDGL